MKRLGIFLTWGVFLVSLMFQWSGYADAQTNRDGVIVRLSYASSEALAALAAQVDIWEVHPQEGFVIALVSQSQYEALSAAGWDLEIDENLTQEMRQTRQAFPGQTSGIPGYPCYRTVEETYASAAGLAAAHPLLAAWTDIGDSWEKTTYGAGNGYDLMALKLTNSQIAGDKPKLLINAGLHAREYVTAELALRFAEYLLANYGFDPDVTWILDHQEIHLIFQSNPDGRKQAEAGALWRKNTNQNYCTIDPSNRGADLNRNFDFQWGVSGDSGYTCAYNYRGASPASEPETQALQDYMWSQFPDHRGEALSDPAPDDVMGVFIDLHSYGGWVLWPWGFTRSASAPNHVQLQTLGRALAFFNDYQPAQASGLYPASGATDDYIYGQLGVASFTFEMGGAFFESCAQFESQILPDNLQALLFAAKVTRAPYLLPSGPDVVDLALSESPVLPGMVVTLTAEVDDTRYNQDYGAEPVQAVMTAQYALDVPFWEAGVEPVTLTPADGAFDTPVEAVLSSIDTSGWAVGTHVIYVRGQDANGNWGPVSAIWLEVVRNLFLPLVIQYNETQ